MFQCAKETGFGCVKPGKFINEDDLRTFSLFLDVFGELAERLCPVLGCIIIMKEIIQRV